MVLSKHLQSALAYIVVAAPKRSLAPLAAPEARTSAASPRIHPGCRKWRFGISLPRTSGHVPAGPALLQVDVRDDRAERLRRILHAFDGLCLMGRGNHLLHG